MASDEFIGNGPAPEPDQEEVEAGEGTAAEEATDASEGADKARQELAQARIDLLGQILIQRRQKWVMWRKAIGVEERWRGDMDVYYGRADPTDEGDYNPKTIMEHREPVRTGSALTRSQVRINITAAKTDAAVAKVQEIQFPTDDKNYALDPEGVDDYEEFAQDQRPVIGADGQPMMVHDKAPGQPSDQPPPQTPPNADGSPSAPQMRPATVADAALIEIQKMRKAASAKEKQIDVAFRKCDYASQGREVIEWGGILGTGIMKGPIVKFDPKVQAQPSEDGSGVVMVKADEARPAAESIDPRCYFPDPDGGPDIRNHSGGYEVRMVSGFALRDLAEQPNYLPDRIRKVLLEGPKTALPEPLPGEEMTGIYAQRLGTNYELWEYHGEVEPEVLSAILGKEVDQLNKLKTCIIIVNDEVIGAYQYTAETDMAYSVFNWKKDKETIFGYGIPYGYRTQQRVINASWRAAMDNMGVSSGCQIVMLEGVVQGADGNNEIRGRKVWEVTDGDDVEKAFKVFDVPSKLDDLIKLIDKANDLGDKEMNFPDIMQGIKGSAPDQVGSLIALLTNAEGVLRRVVKQYDDGVTIPTLKRFEQWFEENGDAKGKGKVNVVARGADVLFTRSMKTALLMALAKMADNQNFGPHLKVREILIELMKSGYVDPTMLMYSEQEVEAKQKANPPAPPLPLTIAQIRASADEKSDQAMLQRQQLITDAAIQKANQQHEQRMEEMNMRLQTVVAQIAGSQKETIDQVRAQLAGHIINANTAKQLQANDAAVKASAADGAGLAPQAEHVS